MFNLTEKSKDFFLHIGQIFTPAIGNAFGNHDNDVDAGLKNYCKSEYGDEWYYAYNTYKTDGRFPSPSFKK